MNIIDRLLECSADELEAMTDEQLKQHFDKYFIVTRPELAEKPKPKNGATPVVSKQFAAKVNQLGSLGIDVSFLLKPKKRKF